MLAIGLLFVGMLCDWFRSRRRLQAEILLLRHQLNILQLRAPSRPYLSWADRALFIWAYRRFPRILGAITIVRPETVVRWHRMGFAAYWRWKSRSRGGRPRITQEIRDLIRRMSLENRLWGATKIHGELLNLDAELEQLTVNARRTCAWRIRKLRCDRHLEQTAAMIPPSVVGQEGAGGQLLARSFSRSAPAE
jgi:hypothetical protein